MTVRIDKQRHNRRLRHGPTVSVLSDVWEDDWKL